MSGARSRRPTPAYGDVVVRALRPRLRLKDQEAQEEGEETGRHPRTSRIWRLERPASPDEEGEEVEWHDTAVDALAETARLPDGED